MTRAAAYLRVSTDPQLERFGPESQRHEIEQYAKRHGFSLVEVYADAITGKSTKREQLDRLLKEAGAYDVILVSGVDRLARRVPISYGVVEELLETGRDVHSADMGRVDFEDDTSALNFGVRSVFADAEHRKINKRLYDGKTTKVRGKNGQPGEPVQKLRAYGWTDGAIDEREAHWVREAYTLVQSYGYDRASQQLNARGSRNKRGEPWNAQRLRDLVTNPLYKGEYHFGRRGKKGVQALCHVQAIVTPAMWHATLAAIEERKRNHHKRGSRPEFELTGHITCVLCGRAMAGAPHANINYYVCSTRFRRAEIRHTCTHRKYHNALAVHAAVRSGLAQLTLNDQALTRAMDLPAPQPVDVSELLKDVERRKKRLQQAYDAGAYEPAEFAQLRRSLIAEEEALQNTTPPPPPPVDLTAARALLQQALGHERLDEIARALGLRVRLHPEGALALSLRPPVTT